MKSFISIILLALSLNSFAIDLTCTSSNSDLSSFEIMEFEQILAKNYRGATTHLAYRDARMSDLAVVTPKHIYFRLTNECDNMYEFKLLQDSYVALLRNSVKSIPMEVSFAFHEDDQQVSGKNKFTCVESK